MSEADIKARSPLRKARGQAKAAAIKAAAVRDECPLAWLSRRRAADGNPLISPQQRESGDRLANDFWFAQMTPRVTSDWSAATAGRSGRRSSPDAGAELQDSVIAAGERVRRALSAVGPEFAGVLIDVCCHMRGLEQVERSAGWPQRSAKIVLLFALTALARHYGLLPPPAPPEHAARRLRHWGSDDFRPTIDTWKAGVREA